jgi:hypothetical protein
MSGSSASDGIDNPIVWLRGPGGIARAGREGKPVLLSITAAWCRACHEMDRTTYADPGVAALIRDRFVPVGASTRIGAPTSTTATTSADGRRPRSDGRGI